MNKFLKKIIGNKKDYTLEHRVLNASMLLTALLSVFAVITNSILGLGWIVISIPCFGVVFFFALYLLSFYKHQYKLVSIFGLGVLPTIFLPLIWFTNEGSSGSSPFVAFLILTGILTIAKGKIKKILVLILILTTVLLLVAEYLYPELLILYPGRLEKFLDLIIAFIIVFICTTVYINIYYTEYHTANTILTKKNMLLEKTQQEIIVQQNKIEAQKIELEKKATALQEVNKTKDRFFTIIAHDLKNPFNALIGFSELIKQAVENKDLEEIKNINEIILQSSIQTHKLLLNLLEWAKAQTNGIQYNPEKIDIKKIIEEHIELFVHQVNKKNIILKDETNHCMVFADLNLINTVLRNLISNAIKYTQNGEIKITCSRQAEYYKISISDTGVGISEEILQSLFDIDKNTSTPGTEGERGTGLGLILSKELIEKNKGEISVESIVNEGSTFSFSLPIFDLAR